MHRVGSQAVKILVFARGTVVFGAYLIGSRPDLVHLHTVGKTGSFSRNAILARLAHLARVPVILHVHASTFDVFYDNSPRMVRSLVRATLNRVDAIAALDERAAHALGAIAPDTRVVVIPDAAGLDALYREVSNR